MHLRLAIWFFSLLISAFTLMSTEPAQADYALLDNGEIMQPGHFKLTGSTQILTESGGANLAARFDAGINEEMGFRGLLGLGKTDVFVGGLFKWMPIPDIERQPTIGTNVGMIYVKDNNIRDLLFRFEPLLAKKVVVERTVFTPYASIPFSIRNRSSSASDVDTNTRVTWQLVAGSQLEVERWKNIQFLAEVGIKLDNAPSYIAVGALIYFDEQGFSIE